MMKACKNNLKRAAAGILPVLALTVSAALTPAIPSGAFAEEHEVIGGNYFLSDYDTREEAVAEGGNVAKEIIAEGTVLLKNEDNVLPLKDVKNISLLGKGLYTPQTVGIVSALGAAGYNVNGKLVNFYNNSALSGPGYPAHPANGAVLSGYYSGETPLNRFTDEVKDSVETDENKANGVAIVGFYRTSGEGYDLPRTMGKYSDDYAQYNGGAMAVADGARAYDDHFLQLTKDEADLLKYCGENFKSVIVLLNTCSPMELGFLDDPDHYAYHENIKGALWLNSYLNWGVVADVLTGKINPSGRLPDTYARDFKADPSWNNFGNNFMENYGDTYAKGNQYANLPKSGDLGGGGYANNYVYYKEGIYSAYRYWETRGFTEGLDTPWTGEPTDTLARFAHGPNEAIHYYSKTTEADKAKQEALDGKEWNNWYEAHVVYPFGYGLSYTSFEYALENITVAPDVDGDITATVKVTNTGRTAGKEVVQLYYSAPYIDGQIEKSHVKLGAFAKTALIQPGKSDTVSLTFKVKDMASYDYNDANKNGFKGYELDAGDYDIYIGKNAHCWAEDDVIKQTYTLAAHKYEIDEVTKNKVENRFDEISEQLLHEDRYPEDDDKNQKDLYMSRADWSGTYPTLSYRLTAEDWIVEGLKQYTTFPQDKESDPWYVPEEQMPATGVKHETVIKLKDLFGLDYDHPLWSDFLDQLTYDQLYTLALRGSYKSGADIPEFGITEEHNHDGPNNLAIKDDAERIWMPTDIMTAATWNEELGYRRGKAMADMSLWGGRSIETRIAGWYAPAINIHRNPFGGRVNEYFSEDGVLTGKISAALVRGSQEKGMFCYVKHFAINAQETNRCGLLTWANEQSMREVYFTPFEIVVKEGKTMGIMSSLNRFGYEWAGGTYGLLTSVLRDEWGFRGIVVTDSFMGGNHSNADVMIRAGGSLSLGNGEIKVAPKSATVVTALRNGAHDVLYAHANSMAINEGDTPTVPKRIRRFESKKLEIGMVNNQYDQSIADCIELNTTHYPDINISEVKFALAENSTLPNGLTLSESGVISGTPRVEANQNVTIVAQCGKDKLTATFAITVVGEGGAIIYPDKSVDTALIGREYTAGINTAYIYDPYATEEETEAFPAVSYALGNGSLLPEGLTLSADGVISGTPVKECRDYTFTVVASAMGYRDAECVFTLNVLYALTFSTKQLKTAAYGLSYVDSVSKAVCDVDVTYSLKAGSELPKGLSLTPGGYIVGVPTAAVANHKFTVVASAPYAVIAEEEYSVTVTPTFDAMTKLPSGSAGEDYFGSAGMAQGAADIKYTLAGGELPKGLTLSEDGTISGVPERAGVYNLIIEARTGDSATTQALTLYIAGVIPDPDAPKAPANTNVAAIVCSVIAGVVVLAAVGVLLFLKLKKPAGKKADGGATDNGDGDDADDADKADAKSVDADEVKTDDEK